LFGSKDNCHLPAASIVAQAHSLVHPASLRRR
jgi:hypothetical protein